MHHLQSKLQKKSGGGGHAPGPPCFANSLRESANLDPFSVIEPPLLKKARSALDFNIHSHDVANCWVDLDRGTLKTPCVNEISEDCDDLVVNNWLFFKYLL